MINPYLSVILAAIIWGSAGVFIKYINLPITTITFFRVFVPAIILLLFFILKKKNIFQKKDKIMLFASSLNAVYIFLYFVAYTYTSITNSVIILYTWPIFATIFSVIIIKEHITKRNLLLLVLCFIGIIFIYSNKTLSFENKDFLGMTSMLIAAAIYSLTITLYKKTSQKYSEFEIIFYQNFIASIIFLPFIFINKPLPSTAQSITSIIYAIIIGLMGYLLFFYALKRIKASTVALLSYLEVISGILFGIVLFNEILTLNVFIGGSLIIVSALFIEKH